MDLSLKGKTALVCGASQGIGAAAAEALAGLGARVIALARNTEALKALVARLPGQGHAWIAVDVGDRTKLEQAILEKIRASGPIEILVNNSGGPKGGPIAEARDDEFTGAFAQHVLANALLARLLLPGMKERGYGRIINVISTSVKIPIPGLGVSNTIRGAVASWAKTLSYEVAPFGVTVNNVLPGYTETPRLEALVQAAAEKQKRPAGEIAEEWRRSVPAARFGKPEETASAIAFLASPAAAYINGVSLPVDGGRTGSL